MRQSRLGRDTIRRTGETDASGLVDQIVAGEGIRLNPPGGTGTVTVSNDCPLCVYATTAALSAHSVTDLNDGAIAYVTSLKDFYRLNKTSAAAVDATNFLVIAATTGRWFRAGLANQEWVATTTWYVDASAGNNENSGTTALLALKTFSELNRRLHGLTGLSDVTVNVLTNIASGDSLEINFGGNVSGRPLIMTFVGVITVGDTGAISAVTNPNKSAASGGQTTRVTGTPAAGWAAAVGSYIRFLNGATFRCSGWVLEDKGANVAELSICNDENGSGPTAEVNPVALDNYQICTFSTMPRGPLINRRDVSVVFKNFDFPTTNAAVTPASVGGIVQFFGCKFSKLTNCPDSNYAFSNCWFTAGGAIGGDPSAKNLIMGGAFYPSASSNTVTFTGRPEFLFTPTFKSVNLEISAANIQDSLLCIIDVPNTQTAALDLRENNIVELLDLWGGGNACPAINMADLNTLGVFSVLNMASSNAKQFQTSNASFVAYLDLASLAYVGTWRDTLGNRLVAAQNTGVTTNGTNEPAFLVADDTITPFLLVYRAATGLKRAKADVAATAGICGVAISKASATDKLLFVTDGVVPVQFVADPTVNDIAYVSEATAGYATATVPPVAGTNQKSRIGRVVSAVGGGTGIALVMLDPELIPVLSDGVAP